MTLLTKEKCRGRPKDANLVDWDLVRLGSKQDKEIAAELGVSPPAVRKQRIKRGIKPFPKRSWDSRLLGILPDSIIARMVGRHESTVNEARWVLGISRSDRRCVTEEGEPATLPEAIIDLFWHQNNINHKFQVKIGKYVADWVINEKIAVEYAGLINSEMALNYNVKLIEKELFYKANGYETLIIYPYDLSRYDTGEIPRTAPSKICISCGKRPLYFRAKGICNSCYRKINKTIRPKSGAEFCIECGRRFGDHGKKRGIIRHSGHGQCQMCYEKHRNRAVRRLR